MTSPIRLLVVVSTTIAAMLLVFSSVAMAGTFPVVICGSSPRDPADGLSWSANAPLVATAQCPYNGPGLELYSPANKTVGQNATAAFKVTAPGGIDVYSIHVVNAYSSGIGTGAGGASSTGTADQDQRAAVDLSATLSSIAAGAAPRQACKAGPSAGSSPATSHHARPEAPVECVAWGS
jgi:hypothetical protein